MDEPIKEKKTLYEKVKLYFKNLFKKKKPDYNEILEHIRKNNEELIPKALKEFTVSTEQAGKALVDMSKVLSKNEIKEILDYSNDNTTLYANGKPYCILKNGEPIWFKEGE